MYYLILYTLFYYLTYNNYLFMLLFGIDNLFISYNVFCQSYQKNYELTYYNEPYYDRYIYYFLIILLNPLIHLLFYNFDNLLINYLLFLSSSPPIIIYILDWLEPLITIIKHKVEKIKKLIKYHVTNYILKKLCEHLLSIDPCFNLKEIAHFWKKNHKENIFLFFKNVIVLIVIKAISNSNTLNIVKKLYNTRAYYQYKDPHPNIYFDIEKIKMIVMKRQWEEFFNPYIIETLYKILENKEIDDINDSIKTIENSVGKLLTVLCLSKISYLYFNELTLINYLLIGITSILLSSINVKNIIIKIIGVVIAYTYDNFLLGAIICEFTDLFFSNVFIWIINNIYKWFINNKHIITHYNHYNYNIFLHIMYFYYIYINNIHINTFLIYNFIFLILNASNPFLTFWFCYFGYFSNYNLYHMLFLAFVVYILINFYYSKNAPKPTINMEFIQNYQLEHVKYDVIENYEFKKSVIKSENVQKQELEIENENQKFKNENLKIENQKFENENLKNENLKIENLKIENLKNENQKFENENLKNENLKIKNAKNNYTKVSSYKPLICYDKITYNINCHVLNSMHNPKYNLEPM